MVVDCILFALIVVHLGALVQAVTRPHRILQIRCQNSTFDLDTVTDEFFESIIVLYENQQLQECLFDDVLQFSIDMRAALHTHIVSQVNQMTVSYFSTFGIRAFDKQERVSIRYDEKFSRRIERHNAFSIWLMDNPGMDNFICGNNPDECVFRRVSDDYLLTSILSQREKWRDADDSISDDIIFAAQRLFNAGLYVPAETLAYLAMRYLMQRQFNSLSLRWADSLVAAGLVVSEVARKRGDTKVSTIFSMHSAFVYSINELEGLCDIHDFAMDAQRRVLMKLRILMTLPPLPPDYSVSKQQRRDMLLDLARFQNTVRENAVHTSIEVFS